MKARQYLLAGLIGIEVIAFLGLTALRLNSTKPIPPRVELDNDLLTGRELLSLPDQFLFDSIEKWRTLGRAYMAYGYFAKADACLLQAAARDPGSAEIALDHGYCLARLGKLEDAVGTLGRAAGHGRGVLASRAWYNLARVYLRLEMPEEAAEAFSRSGDDNLAGVCQRATLLVRSGRTSEAEPLLKLLVDRVPMDLDVCQLRARAAEIRGDYSAAADALDALERARSELSFDETRIAVKTTADRYGVARLTRQTNELLFAGNASAAANLIARIVRDDVRYDRVYLRTLQVVADVQLKAGNAQAARELMARQIEEEEFPTVTAWALLGEAEFQVEQFESAKQAWIHAEQMQPAAIDHSRLATVLERLGDPGAARRHRAVADQYTGIALFRNDNLEDARESLRQSASIDPGLPDVWFYLGETERLTGTVREAEAAYRRCLKLLPTHGRARARLARLANLTGPK